MVGVLMGLALMCGKLLDRVVLADVNGSKTKKDGEILTNTCVDITHRVAIVHVGKAGGTLLRLHTQGSGALE